MITGSQLRDARSRARLTQEELANLVGVTLRSVGNWERSQGVPRSQEGAVRAALGGYLDESLEGNPLASVSDVALLAEIGRRLGRAGGQTDAGNAEAQKSNELEERRRRRLGGDPVKEAAYAEDEGDD